MIACSVSLKFDTFPSSSIPLEKYRVPARNLDLRDIIMKVSGVPLTDVFLISSMPNMAGRMNGSMVDCSRACPNLEPFPSLKLIRSDCINLFQKNLSSALCHMGKDGSASDWR